uniref:Uncharacterized protein n=1 Tax=Aegilops tauschii subsp. strangulata TaxID=200361 RepID=A0A453SGZ4_AEGTS
RKAKAKPKKKNTKPDKQAKPRAPRLGGLHHRRHHHPRRARAGIDPSQTCACAPGSSKRRICAYWGPADPAAAWGFGLVWAGLGWSLPEDPFLVGFPGPSAGLLDSRWGGDGFGVGQRGARRDRRADRRHLPRIA